MKYSDYRKANNDEDNAAIKAWDDANKEKIPKLIKKADTNDKIALERILNTSMKENMSKYYAYSRTETTPTYANAPWLLMDKFGLGMDAGTLREVQTIVGAESEGVIFYSLRKC